MPSLSQRVLFVRRLRRFTPAVTAVVGVLSILIIQLCGVSTATAAAANTVNFQARLQTASGAIVPDGFYNVEFKLYSASSGGTALWTEDYLNSSSQGLKTVNGYLTANLGSITAFPSTINWDQQLWLTMNIGGTSSGSVTWDGEMSPRLTLTAVPFALSAGQLSTTTGSGHSTLTIQGSTSGNQNFVIQDQGAAGTYNLLTTNQANAGYIQLQGSTPGTAQTGNFNISGTGVAGVLQGSTAIKTPAIRPVTDGTSALQVENAAGTVTVLDVDTTNSRIGIGTTTPGASLSIKGAGADSSTIALDVENSAGGALITARNDGQVTIGTNASAGTSTTFGSMANTTPDTSGADSNYFTASKFTTGSNPGTLTSISIYVNAIDPTPANDKFRLAIYADGGSNHPTTLVAQSAEGTLSANTYNTLPVSASLSANTTYWLAYQTNGTSVPYNDFSFASSAPNSYYSYSNPYGSFPSTAGTGGGNGALVQAIYGTYTEAGTSTTPALTVSASGNVGIGVTTPSTALQVQGTVSASALSLTGNGTATAFQAGLFDTTSAGNLNIGTTNATSITLGNTVNAGTITLADALKGGTIINNGSTVYAAQALNNFTSNGAIGTAANTVDIHTSFTLNQTSAGITLTLPSPTDTSKIGRIAYVANVGTATTTVSGITLTAGSSASFFWNGSSWISTAVSTGASIVGTYSSTSITNGASISGNTLTLGVADGTNPGMVSTTTQSFAGAKTFTDVTTVAKTSTTAFQIQNNGGGSTLLTADTSNMKLGIGTAAPSATVDIKGATSDATASALNVQNSAGGSVLKARNDGQVTIGTIASSGTSTTFGNNTHTTGDTNDSLSLSASKFTTGGTAGELTSISIWVNGIDPTAANDKYRLAIYSDAGNDQPQTLIAESAEGTLTANAFNTLTVNASLSASTTYWLAYQTNGSSSSYNNFSTASGSTKQMYYKTQTYGSFPGTGPSGGSNSNVAMAIYGTYTLAGTANVPALTVAASGNIGIGNSSPAYALDLVGTGNFSTSVYAPILDTATAGTLSIGGTNATTVNIANNAVAHTINVATGAAQQTVTIGSTNASSTTTIQGGNGITMQTNNASAGVTVKSSTNSATAFQVQNSSSVNLFNVDTSGGNINLGIGTPPSPLGYTTVGGNTGSAYQNQITGDKYTATQTGTVKTMSVYVPTPDSSPTNHFQVAIYSDSGGAPSAYIASSASTVLTSGWNTVSLTSTPTLNAGTTYWLVYWADVNDGSNSGMAYDSGQSGATFDNATSTYGSGASNGMPTTFPAASTNANIRHSIYVTFASTSYAATISSTGALSVTGAATFTDNSNSTTAFQIQNSGATALFTADTVNNKITIGSSGQFSVDGSGNVNTTGTATVKTSSSTAFQVQNSSATSILTVDTANSQVTTENLNAGSAANISGAGHLFSDGFESGNTNFWGGTVGGSFAADTGTVHNGKYSMKFTSSNSSSAIRNVVTTSSSTVYAREYVYVSSQSTDLETMYLDPSGTGVGLQVYRANANGKICVSNGIASTSVGCTAAAVSTGAWHKIELIVTEATSTTGTTQLIVDGTSAFSVTAQNNGTNVFNRIAVGNRAGSETGVAYVDDVVYDTVDPGDSANLNVADSFHASGTASFGGVALFQSAANSATAFQVQNNSSVSLLTVDTSGNTVNVGVTGTTATASSVNIATSTGAAQTVTIGSTNTSSTTKLQAGGSSINVTNSAVAVTGTLQAASIQNLPGVGDTNSISFSSTSGISVNSVDGFATASNTLTSLYGGAYIMPSSASTVGVKIAGQTSQTGDLMQLTNFSNQVLSKFNSNGDLQIGNTNSAASTTAFQVQNSSGTSILTADTTNAQVNALGLNVGGMAMVSATGNLLNDGFENNSFANWTAGTAGSPTVSTSVVRNGKYAANFSGTAQNKKATITSNSTVYARAYVNFASQTTSGASFLWLASSAGTSYFQVYRQTDGTVCLQDTSFGTSGQVGSCTGNLTLGAWHEVELRITTSATVGQAQLWLDGTQIVSTAANQNYSATTIAQTWIGTGGGETANLYVDDVSVGTTDPGASADSLHVTGTSTLAGNVLVQAAANSTTSFQVQNSSGTTLLAADTVNMRIDIKGTQSTASLGSNLLTNGNFATNSCSSWTCGAGWAAGTGAAVHTTGNTAALSQTVAVTAGTTYQIDFTQTGSSAGALTFAIGANTDSWQNWDSNTHRTIVAPSTGSLTFSVTPTTDFNGTVDNFSVAAVTGTSIAVQRVLNSDGTVGLEMRSGGSAANNSFIGTSAGQNTTTGSYNAALGTGALQSNTTGSYNASVGSAALQGNTTGTWNTAVGQAALYSNTVGSSNVAIGQDALYSNVNGTTNTVIGASAGYMNTSGYGNIFIGATAGFNETGNNKLYIANSSTSTPLIGGDFSGAQSLNINGNATFMPTSGNDSSSAFKIQSSTSVSLFAVDSSAKRITIGTAGSSPTLLVFANKTDNTSDPTGVEGGMYYNAVSHSFRCYINSFWQDCATGEIDYSYNLTDDFFGGASCSNAACTSSASLGAMGWGATLVNGASNGTVNGRETTNASAAHPGVLSLTTGTTSGVGLAINMSASYGLAVGQDYKSTIAVSNAGTARMLAGLFLINGSIDYTATAPIYGVYWRAGATNWEYCYGNGSTGTCTSTGVAVAANTWARTEIRINALGSGTSNVDFVLNGTTYNVSGVTVSDNSGGLSPNVACATNTGSARTCYIDYYQMRGYASSAR